ncbi:MAG TPA: hypothetical protein VJS66_07310 [Burkholderiales bacterium]|nr:hypothetical protein [Burkholderiales bacterium]
MKRITGWSTVFFLALVLIGCATPQKNAMKNFSDNRNSLDEVRGQIDRTLYSADNLMRAPATEIVNAQTEYSTNVKSLRKLSDQLEKDAKDARDQRIEYLTEWERARLNVTHSELKRTSDQRRDEVSKILSDLETSLRLASESVAPLVVDLEDIDRLAGNDPTPAGIAAVRQSGVMQTAQQRALTANNRLDVAASQFNRALAALSPQPNARSTDAGGGSGATGSGTRY